MARIAILPVLVAAVVASVGPASAAPQFPQVKIDRVDARNPGDWRLVVTALGEDGRAKDLRDAEVAVFLGPQGQSLPTGPADAVARYRGEAPLKGSSGEAKGFLSAGVDHAVVLVVALHAELPGDVRAVLPKVIAGCLGGVGPEARVGLIVYGDGLQVLSSGVDGTPVFRDLNDYQHCLAAMRLEADPAVAPEPGVGCGRLFAGPAAVASAVETLLPAPQGLFPRLLGVPEAAGTMAAAAGRGHARVDRPLSAEHPENFAEGAFEAALRMLAANTRPGTVRDVVLVSDGRDGYLRYADAAWDGVASACMKSAPECRRKATEKDPSWEEAFDHEGGSPRCSRAVVDCAVPQVNRVLRDREQVVRDHLVRLVGWARAADVRVLALGVPGADAVGAARLEALALATGGTWRAAPDAAALAKASAGALAGEMASALVIRPGVGLEAGKAYQVAVRVDGELRSLPYPFLAGAREWPFAGLAARGRTLAIAKLGHGWGPPAFWAAVVLGALAAIGMLWLLGKGIVALVKKAAGKGPKPPKVAKPAIPKLKRPGG